MNWHTDTGTTTEADAGAWERAHNDRWDDDRPTLGELAADAEQDRLHAKWQAERDAARRARGEFVPTAGQRLDASLMRWAFGPVNVEVTPVREGVFRVDGMAAEQAATIAAGAQWASKVETAVKDGHLFIRIHEALMPHGETGALDDGPPF